MADGMCGPSNALQSFQKHTTVDRTLQQDRLVARQLPSQGFRSSPAPHANPLESEFDAFQAGQLPLDHGFQPVPFSHAPPSLQQPGPSNWATDFQRMNISAPTPQLLHNTFSPHAQQGHNIGGWHQEFTHQQNQGPDQRHSQVQQQPQNYGFMPGMLSPQYGHAGQQGEASVAQHIQPQEDFDEEAFERAFQEAANYEPELNKETQQDLEQDSKSQSGVEIGQDIMINESAENFMASDALIDQQRIGADMIYDPETQKLDPDHEEPDALSRTAGLLLDTLRHDQSSKFQNSQFLELMRQFRDGQSTVQGDKVVSLDGVSEMMTGNEALKVAAP